MCRVTNHSPQGITVLGKSIRPGASADFDVPMERLSGSRMTLLRTCGAVSVEEVPDPPKPKPAPRKRSRAKKSE
jgi:hypothetical protein